jgi:hypothetical protein
MSGGMHHWFKWRILGGRKTVIRDDDDDEHA